MIEFVRVAITMDDGSLRLMSFVTKGRGNVLPTGASWLDRDMGLWVREPTGENLAYEVQQATVNDKDDAGNIVITPKAILFRVVDSSELPTEKIFRKAWLDDSIDIIVDMDKARSIRLEQIRIERMAVMPGLDIAWSVAMAKGDMEMAASVEGQRQALRDITQTLLPVINAATTIEELKAISI